VAWVEAICAAWATASAFINASGDIAGKFNDADYLAGIINYGVIRCLQPNPFTVGSFAFKPAGFEFALG
jgi:hypothetical protein